jgi:ATP-dependent DNA helicase PIF1
MVMCKRLEEISREFNFPVPVVRAAPTGVASNNVVGKTLHSMFRLPVKKPTYKKLSAQNMKSLQASLRGVSYLIIDEKSVVSIKQLTWLNYRCREIWPEIDAPFGGLNIVIVGDFCQLPPVGDKPMFNTKTSTNVDTLLGQQLYKRFNQTITLTQVMRQQGEDLESRAFRKALGNF